MPIEALSDIKRASGSAFGPKRITVSASRDFLATDIGNILVYTAAVTLNVPAGGFGTAADVIFIERDGAGASIALTPTSGTPRVDDPLPAPVLASGLMGALTCKEPGIWVRQC